MSDRQTLHTVLGTGPLGLAVARALVARGDRVRVANRSGRADVPEGVEITAANVAEPGEAKRACDGAAVVYHCANPPYANWPELHPSMMQSIIEGASSAGAKLIFGDNLYAFGPTDGPLREGLPQAATGPNGRTRARIAEDLLRAHDEGGLQAAIARGSDFFGPHAHQSMVGDQVFVRALAGKPARVLGDPDLPHTVTYIDDFARAIVALAGRDDAFGRVWHVPNDRLVTLRRFVEMVFAETGRSPRLQTAPSWALALASVFNPTIRAVREQLYQLQRSCVVDSTEFERSFGLKATPLPEAIGATVRWFREHLQ